MTQEELYTPNSLQQGNDPQEKSENIQKLNSQEIHKDLKIPNLINNVTNDNDNLATAAEAHSIEINPTTTHVIPQVIPTTTTQVIPTESTTESSTKPVETVTATENTPLRQETVESIPTENMNAMDTTMDTTMEQEEEESEEEEENEEDFKLKIDDVLAAIRSLKSHKGSSTKALLKALGLTGNEDGKRELKFLLAKYSESGVLTREKQSYFVTNDPKYPDPTPKIQIQSEVEGSGPAVRSSTKVVINYVAKLAADMTQVDDGELKFTIDHGEVIKGFDMALKGMKLGGKRTVFIPSPLGYGKRGSLPEIGPDADLIFEIELIKIY